MEQNHEKYDRQCKYFIPRASEFNFNRNSKLMPKNLYTQYAEQIFLDNYKEIWNTNQKGRKEASIDIVGESCIFMMNFDNSGDQFAYSTESNLIEIWNMYTQSKITTLQDHSEIVTSLEWFKQGFNNMFATCSLDKTIKLWRNYKCIQTLKDHYDWLRCLSISFDNQFMVSGCVSSVVMIWDIQKQKPIAQIKNNSDPQILNTINSVNFQNNSHVFLCGTRDGSIKLFDSRINSKEFAVFQSHTNKLNSGFFNKTDQYILSSGRDNAIRMWDYRKLPEKKQQIQNQITGQLSEYKSHKCNGYNIAAHFLNNEKNIITGSEDFKIFIYDTFTGEVRKEIITQTKVNHLVKPVPHLENWQFAYSGLQESCIRFYGPGSNIDYYEKQSNTQQKQMNIQFNFLEEVMAEYGDVILKIFHKNNFTYSSPLSWDNLINMVCQGNDSESKLMLQNVLQTKIGEYDEEEVIENVSNLYEEENNNERSQQHPICQTCRKNKEKDILNIKNNKNYNNFTTTTHTKKDLISLLPQFIN